MAPTQKRKADEAVIQDNNEVSGPGSESDDSEQSSVKDEHKRQKTAIAAIVKEYQCPLSLELPVEPVTAEDGRVYNRAKHIDIAKQSNNDSD